MITLEMLSDFHFQIFQLLLVAVNSGCTSLVLEFLLLCRFAELKVLGPHHVDVISDSFKIGCQAQILFL